MKYEDTTLTEAERANAEKWIGKHKPTCPNASFDAYSVVSGYGYRMRIVCTACGEREDVTEPVAHDPYPHR